MMKILAYYLLIASGFLLALALPQACEHNEKYRIANPEDCLWLAGTIKSRSTANRIFKKFHQGETPLQREIRLPYAEKHLSCAMGIFLSSPQHNADISSWFHIGEELLSVYHYCSTGYWHLGGTGITGNAAGLLVGIVSSTTRPGARTNDTEDALIETVRTNMFYNITLDGVREIPATA